MAHSISAQEGVPEFVGNTLWEFAQTTAPLVPRSAIFLSTDGRTYFHSQIANPVAQPGRYSYRKTGASTAILELGESATPYTLRFITANTADYQSRSGSGTVTITAVPMPADVALRNTSTRIAVAANQTSLAGFVVAGTAHRRVLIRAIGPSLAQFGVANPAPGTALAVTRGTNELAANRGWGGSPFLAQTFAAAGAFALPAGSRDSALLVTLPPGDYVAQARADGGAGEILIEVYFID